MYNLNKTFINRQIILNTIRDYGPISRTKINSLTDIRQATITDITKELLDENLIIENRDHTNLKPNNPNTNRKKKLLYLNEKRYYAIGINIEPNRVIAIITDLGGNILNKVECKIKHNDPAEHILDDVCNIFNLVAEDYPRDNILGVGVVNPGILDRDKKMNIISSQLENWTGVPIKSILEERLKVPVYLEDFSVVNLLAERWFGEAKDYQDIIYVQLGIGISISMLSNGNSIKGYSGIVGELGHTIVEPNGILCTCGNYGCLQTVASPKVIVRKVVDILEKGAYSIIKQMVNDDLSKIDIDIVSLAAEKNDKIAMSIVDEAGKYLGIALSNTINLLSPQLVIFGGRMISKSNYILEPIKRTIKANTLSVISEDIIFKTASLQDNGATLGAVAMILDKFFMYEMLKGYELQSNFSS